MLSVRINKIKSFIANPLNIIGILALAGLTYTILIPLFQMLKTTFLWSQADIRMAAQAQPGKLTLYHWARIFFSDMSQSLFYGPMRNTLAIGAAASAISLIIGSGLAWLVTRTNLLFKKTVSFLVLVPYLLPAWMYSMTWLNIFKNDKLGGSAGIWQALFHVNLPDWISYGFVPIVASLSIHDSVYFYLIVGAALSAMNSQLEEAASIAGANRRQILMKITLPLILPAILSAFILIFSKAISSFSVPELLGVPVNFHTVATMLYSSMRLRMQAEANALGSILIIVSMLTIFLNQKMTGRGKSFVTVSGKDSLNRLNGLGRWRLPASFLVLAGLLLIAVVPLLLILLQTFLLQEGNYSINNLTWHYWFGESIYQINAGEPGLFRNENLLLGLRNSLSIAFVASIIAALLGLLLGYLIINRKEKPVSRLIEHVSFLPYLIPGFSLSTIYITMFAKPTWLVPTLYGSLALLILITVVKELPFTTRAGISSMIQIGEELEEAAKISGASWFSRFRRLILPLNKKMIFSSFLLVFIGAMKELELIIMLVTPKTETLTTLTFDYAEKGYTQLTDAVLAFIILIIIFIYFVLTTIGKADLSKGIGG